MVERKERIVHGWLNIEISFQGVRGAYSESAAQKAYPNCEAVPCEQFDTAFEVIIYVFPILIVSLCWV